MASRQQNSLACSFELIDQRRNRADRVDHIHSGDEDGATQAVIMRGRERRDAPPIRKLPISATRASEAVFLLPPFAA
jgi:hypothetical protein